MWYDFSMESLFGLRVRELRETHELSQLQLAKEFHVTKQTVSAWEKGLQETDFSMLIEIAKFFRVSTDYLLGLEE